MALDVRIPLGTQPPQIKSYGQAVDEENQRKRAEQQQKAGDIDLQSADIDLLQKKNDAAIQILTSVRDQASYDVAKQKASQLGLPVEGLPPQYDPAVIDQMAYASLSLKDRLAIEKDKRDASFTQEKFDWEKQNSETKNQIAKEGLDIRRQESGAQREMRERQRAFEDRKLSLAEKKMNQDERLFGGSPAQDATGGEEFGPEKPTPHGAEYLKTLNPDIASVVQLIGDGAEKSSTILSRMKPEQKMQILAAVRQYNPDYNANQFGAVGEFGYKKLGSQVRSFNVGKAHLDTLGGLVDALGNGDINLLNKMSQTWATQTGSAAPTNFDTAKQIVGDEIVKAIVGAGGTGEDREKAQAVISSAKSPQQLRGVIDTYKELMDGQLRGLKKQYEQSTGRKNFDDFLLNDEAEGAPDGGTEGNQGDGAIDYKSEYGLE